MDYLSVAQSVLIQESEALKNAVAKLRHDIIEKIVTLLQELIENQGSLVFCGIGKSGHIAQKLASTFCSLGMPSFFLHPSEALHGDLGRVRQNDAIVLLSKSGTTEEIIKLLPFLNPKKNIVGLLGNIESPIAQKCSIILDCSVSREACLNDQAPTTSSLLTLSMGHMMAILFQCVIGLSKEKFALNHPGGILGKKLRVKVEDVLIPPNLCPILKTQSTLENAIVEMSNLPVGGCAICDSNQNLKGILVEGDIRRAFNKYGKNAITLSLEKIMNPSPIVISPSSLVLETLSIMENRAKPLNIMPVIEQNKFMGFIRLHEILKEGFTLSSTRQHKANQNSCNIL